MKHFDTIKQLTIVACLLLACSLSAAEAGNVSFITMDNGDRIFLNDHSDLTCDNATDGGVISGDQKGCADPLYDPSILSNVSLPSGGSGVLQYIWISTTDDPHDNSATWTPINGSTGISYDPGPISTETSYRRCARRSGCVDYVAESNIVTVTLDCCDNVTDGGTIEKDQSICGYSIDVAPITNVTLPSGGSGDLEYVWLQSTECSSYFDGNTDWTIVPNSNSASLDPGVITETTCYIRCARRKGCTDYIGETNVVTVTVNPSPTAGITINSYPKCDNSGKLTAAGSGGTAPYSYAWSTGATTSMIDNLGGGSYSVVITDANGCTASASQSLSASDTPTGTISTTDVSCSDSNDGMATVTASGGLAPYSYNFSSGTVNGNKATNLGAGTHSVVIIDANGCKTTLTFSISKPTPVYVNIVKNTDPKCDNSGKVTATASGGTAPYTYAWSNGGSTAMISSLAAGTYTVTATDAKGCTNVQSITLVASDAPSVMVSGTNITCNGDNNGSASATASGGSGSFTYSWSNGMTTASISGLAPGTYTVVVTDSDYCTATGSVTITEPTSVTVSVSSTNETCGDSNGSASASAAGGTPGYTYKWNTGATSAAISNLAEGTYTVTATDANGCYASKSVTITNAAGPTASATGSYLACNGDNNGTASVTVSGGTAPYTYAWSNGGTTASISGLSAGTYTVSVKDANGCTTSASATVTEPSQLTVSASGNDATCGEANGSASASAAGGTPGYTYAWSNGASGSSASGLTAGTYTVTATDSKGCTATATVSISNIGGPSVSVSGTNVSCNYGNDGSATATATGGSGSLTYAWSNGGTTATITGLTAGTYTVTVTDANGCKDSDSVTITEPTPVTVSVSSTNETCGDSNGSASASAAGGTPGYTYKWSNGATSAAISNLAEGTYTVTATDANGCYASKSVTITNAAGPSASATGSYLACNGDDNGTASVTVSGGTAPYTYAWSNGGTTASISGLSAGTYTVSVKDANGCTTSASATVTEPSLLTVSASGNDATCGEANGSASASAAGGTPGYTYAWSNGASGSSASGLTAGTYTVTATDSKGCTATATVSISNIGGPSVSVSGTNVSCNYGNDGSATASATGGSGSLTYAWSNGGTTATISGLTAGTYTVTVTDANGCKDSDSVTISEPTPVTVSVSSTNETCGDSNGSASASAAGGTPGYTYKWSNGATSAAISNLAEGTYTVTATDANGCYASKSVTITNAAGPSASATGSYLACNGDDNGTASVTVSGGTAPYTYAWSNGGTTASISGLSAGTYTVSVKDANGCTTSASATVTEPSLLTISASGNDATCGEANGSASASAAGGTPGYTYAWSNGASGSSASGLTAGTYTVTATDSKGCTATATVSISNIGGPSVSVSGTNVSCNYGNDGSATATATGGSGSLTYAWSNGGTTATITGLTAGTYTVTVTDANGCKDSDSVTITEPTPVTVSITSTNETCGDSNGSASASAAGGTPGYTYKWSNGATSPAISNLAEGTYTVTATDANGCYASKSVTISNAAGPNASATGSDLACNGDNNGTASVTVSGGTAPYTYAWSNGGTTATITGLSAGTFTVSIKDANGCMTSASATVTEPSQLTVSASGNDATCGEANGSASASAAGGTPGYTYAWSNGDSGATATGLAAGSYTVTATDNNGCYATATVSIGNVGGPSVTVTGSNVSCNDGTNGSAVATVSGGTAPYTYAWNNGGTEASLWAIPAGTYTVTVTDANGCKDMESITITEPTAISIIVSGTNETCGDDNGTASVSASGGTPGYTYSWSNGGTSASISGLTAGTYNVTVTDSNDCTAEGSVTIDNESGPDVVAEGTNVKCFGGSDGKAWANATGGKAPLSYLWSNGGTTANIIGIPAGTYGVTVTDANGCTASTFTVVNEPTELVAEATGSNATCGDANGTASVGASGGTAPYSFLWSNGATTADIMGLAVGTYTATVTDKNNCTDVVSVSINNIGGPSVEISAKSDVSCYGEDDGSATASASGGTAPYTYLWSNGATSATAAGLASGGYTVTVTDSNGCSVSTGVSISQPNPLDVSIHINSVPGCDARGSLTANGSEGTAPYTYSWNTGATGASIAGLAGGSYSVTLTDANGCTAAASISLLDSNPGTITVSTVDLLCNGDNDGKATATLSEGAAPIVWSFSGGTQTNNMTSDLAAGTYGVTATDALGCVSTASFVINEPNLLRALTTTVSAGCDDESGKATVNAQGGTAPYGYLWSTGATTTMIDGLAPGSYGVTVTDANGCIATGNAVVSNDADLVCSSRDVKPATCYGGNDGRATAVATGGQAPYSYSWSNGANQATATNLTAGTYIFTITDANGCTCTGSVTIAQPDELVCSASVTTESSGYNSNDAIAKANASGGTAPYSFAWSNGGTQMSTSNLEPGMHTVTVTDINGCSCESKVTVINKSQLGDRVFSDLNGNGIQDAGEPGIGGIKVTLTNLDDMTTFETTTDGNGNYLFDGLDAGKYKVTFEQPAGFVFSPSNVGNDANDSDANDMGMTETIMLGQGESNLTVDAGIVREGINVGDFVWYDTNQNGIQDFLEDGVSGVKVILTNTADNAMRMTLTDGNGKYLFPNVKPGKYKITFENIPGSYRFTAPDQGGDDSRDSDANDMGMTPEFMVMLGDDDNLTLDAGIHLICDNIIDAGVIAADQKLCGEFVPERLTNVISPSGGNGELEYIWLKNETGTMTPPSFSDPNWVVIPNSTHPTYLPGIVRTTTFYVRCVRRKGCTSYAESNVVKISICDLPVVNANYISEDNCLGDPVDLEAENAGAGATYSWSLPGANPSSANTRVVTGIDYPAIGFYKFTLTVTSAEGCTDSKEYDIWIGCDNGINFNTVNAKSSTDAKSITVDWTLENQTLDNEYFIEQSADGITYETVGSVKGTELMAYTYEDQAPKLGTSFYRIKHINQIGEYVMSDEVKVVLRDGAVKNMFAYPNPATDFIKLELFEPLDDNGMLYIIDGNGRTIKTVNISANTQFIDVDLSTLARGMYFIEVQYDGFKKYRQKVIKAMR